MSLTVTTRVAMAHPQAAANSTPPAWPHFTAASSTNPATTSAVRGEASLDAGYAGDYRSSCRRFFLSHHGHDRMPSALQSAMLPDSRSLLGGDDIYAFDNLPFIWSRLSGA